jgi:hypothetical protein
VYSQTLVVKYIFAMSSDSPLRCVYIETKLGSGGLAREWMEFYRMDDCDDQLKLFDENPTQT